MKKAMILAMLPAAFTFWSCNQHITPTQMPSLVQNALQVKFPAAKDVEWEKEGNLYEAEFTMGTTEHAALVNPAGQVVAHKQDIVASELPAPVLAAVQRDFKAYLLDDLEKVEQNGKVLYQVELENSNGDLKKVYDANGKLEETAFWD
ncbi:PepSY-like domain-containing protein [Rufibacter aurantiacus]|uniref:PepSY-like domain-containing protein n=1 Tax=Rufibacter aurantiacus TaxID=2817374 RepID=UPI001B30A3DC|nr:PepSY-like domain-containing protein [Rufibacter aurantiacus]